MEPGEYVGPAWGDEGQSVRIRCSRELPAVPVDDSKPSDIEITIAGDCRLLQPITKPKKLKKRGAEHTAALTVGKLVHKGIELWRFPTENGIDPVLEESFRKILLQTDNLDSAEQQAVLEKAQMLLARFRDSKERLDIESAEKRWHEIPFSFTKWNYTVNGIIDLLVKNEKGFTIIDFKTDELKNESDLSDAVDRHTHQLEEYREAVKQPKMNKSKVMEEMLADAFADMKTGRRIVEKISKENRSLAQKLADFTKKLLNGVKRFFNAKEVQEKYPEVALTDRQFKNFVERVEENICSVQNSKINIIEESKGYKILTATHIPNSPYKYSPQKQRNFDTESAKELIKKYPSDVVQEVIQGLSPFGHKNKNYGKEVIQGIRNYGR